MSYFVGSINVGEKVIGNINDPNGIIYRQLYPICQFPGVKIDRQITFSNPIRFMQSEQNIIEFVNDQGEIISSFDTGIPPSGGSIIDHFLTIEIPASFETVQTLSVRWILTGGAFQASFTGNIFVFESAESVIWL